MLTMEAMVADSFKNVLLFQIFS